MQKKRIWQNHQLVSFEIKVHTIHLLNHIASSASLWKNTFRRCAIPFSTWTYNSFLSCTTSRPLHCPQLSFSSIVWCVSTVLNVRYLHKHNNEFDFKNFTIGTKHKRCFNCNKESNLPDPMQCKYSYWICCNVLRPVCRIETFVPKSWQAAQRLDAPVLEPFLHNSRNRPNDYERLLYLMNYKPWS